MVDQAKQILRKLQSHNMGNVCPVTKAFDLRNQGRVNKINKRF